MVVVVVFFFFPPATFKCSGADAGEVRGEHPCLIPDLSKKASS